MDSGSTAVYHVFDHDGSLIYIGISNRPVRRLLQHLDDKVWHHEIARIDVTWFEDRPTAARAERFFIRMSSPRHNTIHVPAAPYRWPEPQPCPRCGLVAAALSHAWRDNAPANSNHFCEACDQTWTAP